MDFSKSYSQCRFGQIHYQICGSGKPLILCHQSPSSLEMFQSVYPLLAKKGVMAIGVDTPGYGQSDVPKEQPTIHNYAECVMNIIKDLGLEKTAVLGHHTGACIAAELAVMKPDLITQVILNGPPLMTDEEKQVMIKAIEKAPVTVPQKDGSHLIDLWNKRIGFTPGWTNVEAMHRGVVQMLRADENDFFGFQAAFEQDLHGLLLKIEQPTMILTNTGDDIYFAALRAKEIRPDFLFKELSGGTHDIVDEQPEAWADIVTEFFFEKK